MIIPPTFEQIRDLGNYGGVLMFMHWALSQPDGKDKTLGELFVTGLRVCNLPMPTREMELKIFKAAQRLTDERPSDG